MSRRLLFEGAFALALAAAIAAACARQKPLPAALLVSGIVEATEVDLRSEVAATVARVLFAEGDRVEKGALVCVLDDSKLAAEAAAALAAVKEAEARLAELRAGARAEERERARARVDLEASRLRDAERELRYARELEKSAIGSKDARERAEIAVETAKAALELARRDLDLVLAGAREEEIRAFEAALEAARRRADLARLRVEDAQVRAPLSAIVVRRYVEPGESVVMGALLFTLADLTRVKVKVYVGERDLAALRIGAPAEVTVDGYPGRAFSGRLTRLATEAEFTPKNLQTKEDRVKLVFEAEIEVPNPDGALKPGMPADVRLPLAEAPAALATNSVELSDVK